MRREIRIAGFGGQGIVLAGRILGEAAINSGHKAVQTQSYGPESRGGAARSEVVISDKEIDYPRVVDADILVALSQPGYDKYHDDVKKSTVIIADADLVEGAVKSAKLVPFTKTADSLGKKIVANIVMLGYLTAVIDMIPKKKMADTIKDNIPKGTESINMKAFQKGYALGMKDRRR
ncbi:MAG: 2-oxoacid:acceptor oxidoreductase family protein [Thermoplasmata archaeon]|nr:MAG: 2-oxoacid:acceptor oxidoreductase family protein [Thermoplasmata archaeon]